MTASKQPTVRVNLSTKQKLDEIQALTDLSQPALLDRAVNLLDMEIRAQQFVNDMTDLISNPNSLRQYSAISAVLEGASADGLRKE